MKNFKYAYERIVNAKKIFEPTDRDFIFDRVLELFNKNPVNIFQIGAIETFDERWRYGSGWSDVIFGSYIKRHGGSLTICDIDLDHIANSYFMSSHLGYKADFDLADASEIIGKKEYDIYYLDGGNDPDETKNQYDNIVAKKCVIIIDDLFIKGASLMKDVEIPYKYSVANGVGIIIRD